MAWQKSPISVLRGFSAGLLAIAMGIGFVSQTQSATASTSLSPLLWLDASNASSYPGTGTQWFDLSPNTNPYLAHVVET